MMLVLLVPLKTIRASSVPRLWALGFSMVAEVLQLILWTMAMSVYAACETVWLLVEMVDGWASYHVLTADARLLHARARLARAQRAKLLVEHGDFPQEARCVNALRGPQSGHAHAACLRPASACHECATRPARAYSAPCRGDTPARGGRGGTGLRATPAACKRDGLWSRSVLGCVVSFPL